MTANILVIGSGGREHALAWALSRSPGVEAVWVAPGNGGMVSPATGGSAAIAVVPVAADDGTGIVGFCRDKAVTLVVIGPEAPLAAGLADELREQGLTVFGPGADGAQLEASKAWAKQLMTQAGVPTAPSWVVTSRTEGLDLLHRLGRPPVVKADGLAAGKGVTVASTMAEAEAAVDRAFAGAFGRAGEQLVLEERLEGPEVSVLALCDGRDLVLLPPAQDHKRIGEGDTGPNTGGMGAYAPVPFLDQQALEHMRSTVFLPVLAAIRDRGIDYRGVIYAGMMLTATGPKVIEFNCRFGDPECQCVLPLLDGNLAAVLQACALGQLAEAPALSTRKSAACACVVAAAEGYPGPVRRGDPITDTGNASSEGMVFYAGVKRGETGQIQTAGGRVLASVGLGDDFDQAFDQAYNRLGRIDYAGKTVRSDIGHQVRRR
ncbi:MAG: phosphoribosylamine--glycine ligase [Cyanobacteria bacterium MAG APA_bin_95]|uniref:Phosphoribosylamine--glycine ligase n=1 Tax=Candidatus Synechococcus spongiarum LMB bulk15M TaxID=1943582 RepID=A0A1T1D3I7_9SYNE|nr:phosphoribosylamine--glycine ligase [Cyanobacteria bacterium MAG APA_bin_95]OOV35439.1 phosphoribosylamine--glycine ligase [Candidatus Synechococcus spongiarum LMB bulk15M]